ncbi:MAG TPA: hypothetical protein VIN59_09045 [Alphaproteobacteria bacterium]
MKRALILSLRNSDFTEMFRLARAIRDAGAYDPWIVTYTAVGNDVEFQQRRCDEEKIKLIVTRPVSLMQGPVNTELADHGKVFTWFSTQFRKMHELRNSYWRVVYAVGHLISYVILFLQQIRQFRNMIHDFRPDILIVAEDIVGLILPSFIKMGHKAGIPTVIVPYTIANATEAAESLHVYPSYQVRGVLSRVMSFFYPRWVYDYKGHRLFRLPLYYMIAHTIFRLTPPDPWTMNSGYANAIAIENAEMKKYYEREGFLDSKLRITGAIYDDTLTSVLQEKEQRREAVYKQLGLPVSRRLIVVGAPPNQLATPRPGCPYKTYEDVLSNLARELKQAQENGWNVIIRPHPNFMDIEKYFEPYGLRVTDIDTADLIPLADIYLAYASATIRWAIACGIPCINYDLFQYHYNDYKGAPGVIHAYQPNEFEGILQKLTSDDAYYAQVKQAQDRVRNDWGHTDGQSTARMIALFDELTQKHPAPRTPTTHIRKRA